MIPLSPFSHIQPPCTKLARKPQFSDLLGLFHLTLKKSVHLHVLSLVLNFTDQSTTTTIITRAVRHWVKVLAPVLFFGIFSCSRRNLNMQASIACILGLVTCHLNQSNMVSSTSQSCCFEQLVLNDWNTTKWEFLWKKVIRKGLKRARRLLSEICSLQGKLHNTSLSGTNKYRRTADKIVYIRPVISHQGRFQVWLRKKNGKGASLGTTDTNFHGQRRLFLEQQLCYLIMHVFWISCKTWTWFLLSVSATMRLRVQIQVRLDSPLTNWTSTCEYLEVSNVFVWYKSNGFVSMLA